MIGDLESTIEFMEGEILALQANVEYLKAIHKIQLERLEKKIEFLQDAVYSEEKKEA